MISRIRIASVGRDLGIQIYNQEMLEWQEHFLADSAKTPPEREADELQPDDNFIKDALSIFDPLPKP